MCLGHNSPWLQGQVQDTDCTPAPGVIVTGTSATQPRGPGTFVSWEPRRPAQCGSLLVPPRRVGTREAWMDPGLEAEEASLRLSDSDVSLSRPLPLSLKSMETLSLGED